MKPAAPRVQIGSYPELKSQKYKERVGATGVAFPELEEKGGVVAVMHAAGGIY